MDGGGSDAVILRSYVGTILVCVRLQASIHAVAKRTLDLQSLKAPSWASPLLHMNARPPRPRPRRRHPTAPDPRVGHEGAWFIGAAASHRTLRCQTTALIRAGALRTSARAGSTARSIPGPIPQCRASRTRSQEASPRSRLKTAGCTSAYSPSLGVVEPTWTLPQTTSSAYRTPSSLIGASDGKVYAWSRTQSTTTASAGTAHAH